MIPAAGSDHRSVQNTNNLPNIKNLLAVFSRSISIISNMKVNRPCRSSGPWHFAFVSTLLFRRFRFDAKQKPHLHLYLSFLPLCRFHSCTFLSLSSTLFYLPINPQTTTSVSSFPYNRKDTNSSHPKSITNIVHSNQPLVFIRNVHRPL